jgi:hypothetical protein
MGSQNVLSVEPRQLHYPTTAIEVPIAWLAK